jgi:hypothetical protein
VVVLNLPAVCWPSFREEGKSDKSILLHILAVDRGAKVVFLKGESNN